MSTKITTPIALIGATGHQGQHVVDELLLAKIPIRAVVRDPDSAAARGLAARGVEVVRANQENTASMTEALTGVSALWFMTTFAGPDGTEGETRRGLNVADAAAQASVPRVLFTSVGGAERKTGIPHFESKRRVEERLAETVRTSVLRPVFFMENLLPQLTPDDKGEIVLRLPMPGDVPLQMIAVRDVGRSAARWVADPGSLSGQEFELGTDQVTLDEAAATVSTVFGLPARFEQIPLDYLPDEDLKAMFAWFAAGDAYRADIPASRTLLPDAADLTAWLTEQRNVAANGES